MRYFACLVLAMLSIPAYALTNIDIYSSEIVINGEDNNAEQLARRQGMVEVLVRASGDQEVANNEVVKKALNQTSQYISQLGYTDVEGQKALKMVFNSQQVNGLLTQADLPYWPAERANIMMWVVEETAYDRNIVWEHSNSTLGKQLKKFAQVRGLPLTFPIGDFEDMTGVQVTDIWGGFIDPISQASLRYPVDGVLVVRAQGNNLRWTLYDQSPNTISRSQVDPLTGQQTGRNAAQGLINEVSNYYASRSAVTVSDGQEGFVSVVFSNVNNADAFFTLERALVRLSSVARVDVHEIQGLNVVARVHLLSGLDEFEQEVLRLGLLKKIDVPELIRPQENVQTDTSVSNEFDIQPVLATSNEAPVSEQPEANETDANETDTAVSEANIVAEDEAMVKDEQDPQQSTQPKLAFEWLY